MKPETLRALRKLQEKLRSKSFDHYLRVMNVLFESYKSFDFVNQLSGYFRSRRFDLALRLADSLSEQKYSDATMHFVANQFSQLIRKYPWDPSVVMTDPEGKAIRTFFKSERRCLLLNRKFRIYASRRSPYEYQLNDMRNFIKHVIGDEPPILQILDNCDFGTGASLGVHGNATNLARKILAGKWTVSTGASMLGFLAVMRNAQLREQILESRNHITCWDWESAKSRFAFKTQRVENNKISFVPKTAGTHRAIAVEPLLNGFLQKGTDVFMRHCLKRIGIDLSDQSLNQRLARKGSTDDSEDGFVTIDLSSASDSISIGLVRHLLPDAWFDYLDSIRSKSFKLGDKVYPYSKFCSMGNGFCFPLETLLFLACCKACSCGKPGTDFSVYGDDIVIRKKYAGDVLKLLRVIGFLPNSKKTFISGAFRESCGSDWFGGVDVRPYTLDYKLDSLENLFKWLNLTRRNDMTSSFFWETRDYILSLIPHRFRFFRPFKGNADSGIDSDFDEFITSKNVYYSRKIYSWVWRELLHLPCSDKIKWDGAYRRDSVDMYAALRGSRSENGKVQYTIRRKARTTIVLIGYSGATATWLPR